MKAFSSVLAAAASALLLGAAAALLAVCGPFTDVTDAGFCPFILEIFTLGITTGTTPTTYNPTGNVSRIQMAAFLSRTVDTTLKRATRRAAVNQLWTPKNEFTLGVTTLGNQPASLQFDGADLWVANPGNNTVARVRASDGRVLSTVTGVTGASGVLVAMKVLVAGGTNPGKLYQIDPADSSPFVNTVANNLGINPNGIAFDGGRVWTANRGPLGSVSIITPGATTPWTTTTLSVGLGATSPWGAVFDGANVWVTDMGLNTVVKLDAAGTVLQTVTVGSFPGYPVSDGTSLWIPNFGSDSVTVIRASNGTVLQTLTGNGLGGPLTAAFDGERIAVTNAGGDNVSLWKAADLTPLGSSSMGILSHPDSVCSDGTRFWVTLRSAGNLVRF
jgi:outer membrane lipoprotein-sorting protein